jgi:tRNA(Ile)-lysidine synthase
MSLFHDFTAHYRDQDLMRSGDPLLLAVSGGLDSVVLTWLCKQAGFNCIIAHCNFQLRAEESDRDEQFVRELGASLNIPFHVERFDTLQYADQHSCSVQEAARELRYAWFSELSATEKLNDQERLILTAHHASDNAETVLMHFVRGTGLTGLAGIPARHGKIRRPLLPFTRNVIQQYAKEEGLTFVEDSSNAAEKYTRNYFRQTIIPSIGKVFPAVESNLLDNITRFKETGALYDQLVEGLRKKTGRTKGREWHVPAKQLLAFKNRALVYAFYSPYGFGEKQVDEILKLAVSGSGKYIQSPDGRYRIIHHRHWLITAPIESTEAANYILERAGEVIRFGDQLIETKLSDATGKIPAGDENTVHVDADVAVFPLLIRKWKTGDYFYPLGMRKKKKLSRFFIDQKLSKTEKEKTWVLESAQRVAWVMGQRIDDRMKITASTKNILTVTIRQERP